MNLKVCSPTSIKGVTLIEILVSTSILVIVSAIVLSSIISFKSLYSKDVLNVKANQGLRSVFDVVALELRELGSNLPANFPALIVENGVDDAADRLIIRRNLLPEVLTLCDNLVATSASQFVYFSLDSSATSPVPASCGHGVNASNFVAWGNYLASFGGGTPEAKAYIFDFINRNGEFFTINNVTNQSGSQYYIFKNSTGLWQYNYSLGNAAVYALEEWRLELDPDTNILKIVDPMDPNYFLNIAGNVVDFQVRVEMQDGTFLSNFSVTDEWKSIRGVEISITIMEGVGTQAVTRSWTSKFLPRNVVTGSRD